MKYLAHFLVQNFEIILIGTLIALMVLRLILVTREKKKIKKKELDDGGT